MRSRHALPLLFCALTAASSCSKGDGTATLRFSNAQNAPVSLVALPEIQKPLGGLSSLMAAAPTEFKMMLIAAYITEDINATTQNNVGQTAMVYLNPDCADDIMHCDISAGTAEDGAAYSHIVTSFFDFGGTSATVNAALNSQGKTIAAGTYKYARLEFCKVNTGNANNIKWNDGTVGEQSFKRNQCTVNSSAFTTPISVTSSSTVTITLTYDYSSAITTGASATGDNCVNQGTAGGVCFTLPTFVPSAS
jgi:hypothetical protein